QCDLCTAPQTLHPRAGSRPVDPGSDPRQDREDIVVQLGRFSQDLHTLEENGDWLPARTCLVFRAGTYPRPVVSRRSQPSSPLSQVGSFLPVAKPLPAPNPAPTRRRHAPRPSPPRLGFSG